MTQQDINSLWTKYEDEHPEPSSEVLILDKWGDILVDYYYDEEFHFSDSMEEDVLAWMYCKTLRPEHDYIRKEREHDTI